jgi:hypothetical protein
LAAAAVNGHDIFDKHVQSSGHGGALVGGGNAERGFEAGHAEDVKRQVDTAKVEHDGGERHGE